MAIIEVRELTKSFEGLRALDRVGFTIPHVEILGLIGPNGSGKTTLFNLMTGFLEPTAGEVLFNGRRITGLKPHQIAGLGIGRVFQHTNFFPNLSVRENLKIAGHLKTHSSLFDSLVISKAYRREELMLEDKMMELLGFVGLQDRVNMLAKNLPYGEQRELELVMALSAEPNVLLLDEPATGMNMRETDRLMHLIERLHQTGITILIVEHNMKVVMGICKRIVVVSFGVKIAEGTPEEITVNEEVLEAYLGKGAGNAKG